MRKDRQQKLAAVLSSNSSLMGSSPCSSREADAVAGAMEGALYQPGMEADAYQRSFRAAVQQLRAASSWGGLPGVGGMEEGKGLELVLQRAVAGCEEAAAVAGGAAGATAAMVVATGPGEGNGEIGEQRGAGDGGGEGCSDAAVLQLEMLAKVPVTAGLLEATAAGKRVKALKKHNIAGVSAAADQVVKAWRQRILTAAGK
jgi:hypothetical protein